MKTIYTQPRLILVLIIYISLVLTEITSAQQASFSLTTVGGTSNYMKFRTKLNNIHGTNYTQGYVAIGAPKAYQMLHVAGGNILLTNSGGNPSCYNGAVLFGANYDSINSPAGEWGIEYETLESGGGLNFWKPYPSGNSGSYFLFLKNNGNVGIGTKDPVTKLHVMGDISVSNLCNDPQEPKLLSTDLYGKVIMVPQRSLADNMGNHIAERSLNMLDYSIRNSSSGEEFLIRPDNTTTETGLRFDRVNNMILETGSQNTSFSVVGTANGSSSIWVSNYESGGYGFAMNPDNRTGGIYFDANEPQLIMGFKGTQVGIGTIAPSRELDVVGDIALSGAIYGKPSNKAYNKLQLWGSSNTDAGYVELGDGSPDWSCVKLIAPAANGNIQIQAGGKPSITVRSNEVLFGNKGTIIDLKVNGMVYANEVKVSLDRWEDIVFEKDYRLMPLTELSAFVTANKHLPEIPSEKEVLEKGIDIGEMNALLLKKIEELTLYMIEQQKQIDELKSQIQK